MGERSPGWTKIGQFVGFGPLLLVLCMYWGETLLLEYEGHFGYGQVDDYGLPAALMEQFRSYDTDADGFIDPYEFSFLLNQLEQVYIGSISINALGPMPQI